MGLIKVFFFNFAKNRHESHSDIVELHNWWHICSSAPSSFFFFSFFLQSSFKEPRVAPCNLLASSLTPTGNKCCHYVVKPVYLWLLKNHFLCLFQQEIKNTTCYCFPPEPNSHPPTFPLWLSTCWVRRPNPDLWWLAAGRGVVAAQEPARKEGSDDGCSLPWTHFLQKGECRSQLWAKSRFGVRQNVAAGGSSKGIAGEVRQGGTFSDVPCKTDMWRHVTVIIFWPLRTGH